MSSNEVEQDAIRLRQETDLSCRSVAPALALGNGVVIKPVVDQAQFEKSRNSGEE